MVDSYLCKYCIGKHLISFIRNSLSFSPCRFGISRFVRLPAPAESHVECSSPRTRTLPEISFNDVWCFVFSFRCIALIQVYLEVHSSRTKYPFVAWLSSIWEKSFKNRLFVANIVCSKYLAAARAEEAHVRESGRHVTNRVHINVCLFIYQLLSNYQKLGFLLQTLLNTHPYQI